MSRPVCHICCLDRPLRQAYLIPCIFFAFFALLESHIPPAHPTSPPLTFNRTPRQLRHPTIAHSTHPARPTSRPYCVRMHPIHDCPGI